MNNLILCIKHQMEINFINLETAIKTYDRNSLLCGAYAWRYVYHTIHSCDKWFINPFDYKEPDFHSENMDNPDIPCNIILTDSELLSYLEKNDPSSKQVLLQAVAHCNVDVWKKLSLQIKSQG